MWKVGLDKVALTVDASQASRQHGVVPNFDDLFLFGLIEAILPFIRSGCVGAQAIEEQDFLLLFSDLANSCFLNWFDVAMPGDVRTWTMHMYMLLHVTLAHAFFVVHMFVHLGIASYPQNPLLF
jgi:hypothetical protein